tara:strand:+ start:4531 stop:4890 length:360 start_codon:yes stop_codon:yes gene_type:complete
LFRNDEVGNLDESVEPGSPPTGVYKLEKAEEFVELMKKIAPAKRKNFMLVVYGEGDEVQPGDKLELRSNPGKVGTVVTYVPRYAGDSTPKGTFTIQWEDETTSNHTNEEVWFAPPGGEG